MTRANLAPADRCRASRSQLTRGIPVRPIQAAHAVLRDVLQVLTALSCPDETVSQAAESDHAVLCNRLTVINAVVAGRKTGDDPCHILDPDDSRATWRTLLRE